MHPIFPPFRSLLFITPLTACHLLTPSLCFLLVFISVAVSFLFSCLSLHPWSLLPAYAFACPCLPLFYAYLIFMLVTSFMPLLTSHLSLLSCSQYVPDFLLLLGPTLFMFLLHLFATSCLLSSLLINTLCLLHNIPCSHLITIVH